jgi:hypothetical protein
MPFTAEQPIDALAQGAPAELSQRAAAKSAGIAVAPRKYSFAQSIAVLLVVWILSVTWLGANLNRGWIAHDDGMLAQSAERVLSGQLPHRDFDEVYTGGLSYLHAAAFKLFGMNLMSLRYTLLIFFALWVPALYYCASRFANPYAAGLITLLGVAWSVPNYPASMPSWYSLFFAIFGIAALLKYLESRGSRWLFLAGLCGGFSFLVKSPGIYYVAAALLFFVFLEQSQAHEDSQSRSSNSAGTGKLYRYFLTISVLLLVTALTLLIQRLASFSVLFHFVLPGLTLGLLLLARESRITTVSDSVRFQRLFQTVIPFLAGAAAPMAIFLIPYAASHSLRSFYDGVFVIPFIRLKMASFRPPQIGDLIALIPLVGILAFAWFSKRRESLAVAGALLAALILMMIFAPTDIMLYRFIWMSVFISIPPIIVIGVLAISRGTKGWALTDLRGQQVFLILSALGMCSLIQFPYSSPTYFCYIAPLVALGFLALNSSRNPSPRTVPAMLAIFFIAFVATWVTPGMSLDGMSSRYSSASVKQPFAMPRSGGLRTDTEEGQLYDRLLAFVHQKATNGALYAGPDTPEIYFLGGFTNPTRMVFDAFENYGGEKDRVLAAIDRTQPNVVVINRLPLVSIPLPTDLVEILAERYPQMQNFGKFQVRWRE